MTKVLCKISHTTVEHMETLDGTFHCPGCGWKMKTLDGNHEKVKGT